MMRRPFLLSALATSLGIRYVIADQASPEARGPDGLPLIFWLIKSRDVSGVDAWLDAGGDLEASGYHRATPILAAAVIDDWPMVLRLAARGARLDVTDGRGFSLAWLNLRSRLNLSGPYGPPLLEARQMLMREGLIDVVRTPAEVRRDRLRPGQAAPLNR
jgi:hypothetical protein